MTTISVWAPAIRSELPKAFQTFGNWVAPFTSPTRERTTDAKSGSQRKMKLPTWRSGPTSQAKATPATRTTPAIPIRVCRRLFAMIAASHSPMTAGTRTNIERQSTKVSAIPVLAENAMVTSQK